MCLEKVEERGKVQPASIHPVDPPAASTTTTTTTTGLKDHRRGIFFLPTAGVMAEGGGIGIVVGEPVAHRTRGALEELPRSATISLHQSPAGKLS